MAAAAVVLAGGALATRGGLPPVPGPLQAGVSTVPSSTVPSSTVPSSTVPSLTAPSPNAPGSLSALLPSTRGELGPTTAGLLRVLSAGLGEPALGGSLAVSVVDASDGAPLLEQRAGTPLIPASTAKIATAVAALTALDPQSRLVTRVVAGSRAGEVVLVGGGDTTLAGPGAPLRYPRVARVTDLATQVRNRLGRVAVTRVLVDDSLYVGARLGPGWRPAYVSAGDVAPVSALSVDGGRTGPDRRTRVSDPALAAGQALAAALGSGAPVSRGRAPAGAGELGLVRSPSIAALTEVMLTRSDNDLAESLARQVALATGQPASFPGVAVALRNVLGELVGDPSAVDVKDGSGLSRHSRITPAALSRLLARAAADDPGAARLAPVIAGLPVAGFSGTLERRYRAGPAQAGAGTVRAKTGTLDGVSALAGLVRTTEGRLLAFDLTADGVPLGANRAAEAALDRLASTLASCGCR